MAIRLFVIDSGATARQVKADRFFVIDSGAVARKIKRLFVVDSGGTARQVYQNAVYALPTSGVDVSVGINAVVTASFTSAGAYSTVGNSSGTTQSGNWVTPTSLAPGSYTIRAHQNSGTAVTGSALDSDLALTSTRSWVLTRSGVGTNTANLTLTLKDGGGNTVATASLDLTAQQAA